MKPHEIVREHFERKRRKGYSLRALARDLKVSPTFVSGVFRGRKKLPARLLARLANVLDIDTETVLEIKRGMTPTNPFPSATIKRSQASLAWKTIPKNKISLLKHWYYSAVIARATCSDYDGTAKSLVQGLGLSPQQVEDALAELCQLGILRKQEDGALRLNESFLRISSSQSRVEIRAFHRQMLRKAEQILADGSAESFERRLITGITFSASPEKIAIAKKMLSDAIHEIAGFLSEGECTEVYHLAAHLFPLTKK